MSTRKKRIIRIQEVMIRTGKSRSAIYRDIANDKFPAQIKTGDNTVGWLESAVDGWIEQCVKESAA